MNNHLDRRRMMLGASGVAASLVLPGWSNPAVAAPLSPERGLASYARMLCGPIGEEIHWWYIGDLYFQKPGKSVVPVARALTIGGNRALKLGPREFRYQFREAGVVVDLAGEPLRRNPITGATVEVPLVDEPSNEVVWTMRDDGSILKTAHGHSTALNLNWTETPANLLLLETEPGPNAFALAPGDSGADWKGIESTRTVYAKRASLAQPGFVPAQMIYHVSLKLTPPWLASSATGDHWLIVRGIGQKARGKAVINQDALDLVNRYFPKFMK